MNTLPIVFSFVLKPIGFKLKNNFIFHLSPNERNRTTPDSYVLFYLSVLKEKKKASGLSYYYQKMLLSKISSSQRHIGSLVVVICNTYAELITEKEFGLKT